ncbi:MAG: hypothetical protein P0116_12940 [Candidatus Nitrosocosmicus sp.]|nr:hypothetical protein [Candidatus Nitrosocosmicus sp.]
MVTKKIRDNGWWKKKMENENRPIQKDTTPNPSNYVAAPDEGVLAYLDDVKRSFRKHKVGLVDVGSVKEFNGR